MLIQNGLLQGAAFVDSPNKGGTIVPSFITIHYTAGWSALSAIKTLSNPASKVSAQFVIDLDGKITQMVNCERRAWHAGPSAFMGVDDMNSHSIGIELVNPGYLWEKEDGFYERLATGWSKVPQSRIDEYGLDLTFKAANNKVGGQMYVWPRYPQAQLDACEQLVRAICAAYKIKGLNGHEEIDKRGWKTDPGPAFPLAVYKKLVAEIEGTAGDRTAGATTTKAWISVGALNVREKGDVNSKKVATLYKDAPVTVIHDAGAWSHIEWKTTFGTKRGWIFDKHLRYG